MKLFPITIAAAGAILASGCHSAKEGGASDIRGGQDQSPELAVGDRSGILRGGNGRAQAVIPKAVAYRMSGPYADNVPVNVNAAGKIVSYPAPSDLGPGSTPVDLGGGWWLDRRGVSTNSVFTHYTYNEYRTLTAAPSPDELEAAIIPGAKVTEAVALPMTLSEAEADLPAARASLPVYRLPR